MSGNVTSPCVNICRMDEASGLCIGCFRTLDEIAQWSRVGDDARRAILTAVARRRDAFLPAAPQPGLKRA